MTIEQAVSLIPVLIAAFCVVLVVVEVVISAVRGKADFDTVILAIILVGGIGLPLMIWFLGSLI